MPQKDVSLGQVTIVRDPNDDEDWTHCTYEDCAIEKLDIGLREIDAAVYNPLLIQVSDIPNVTYLSLDQQGEASSDYVVKALVRLLHKNRIQRIHLFFDGLFDCQAFFDALIENTSLTNLNCYGKSLTPEEVYHLVSILQNRNSTLQHCGFSYEVPGMKKLRYYLHLNRHGRSLARTSQITVESFVGLLNAVDTTKVGYDPLAEPELDKLNVYYGLLMECPSVLSPGNFV
jgi:hypothetical protein